MPQDPSRIDPLLLNVFTFIGALLAAVIGGLVAAWGAREAIRQQFDEQERQGVKHLKHRVLHDVTAFRRAAAVVANRQSPTDKIPLPAQEECSTISRGFVQWRHQIVYLEDVRLQNA